MGAVTRINGSQGKATVPSGIAHTTCVPLFLEVRKLFVSELYIFAEIFEELTVEPLFLEVRKLFVSELYIFEELENLLQTSE